MSRVFAIGAAAAALWAVALRAGGGLASAVACIGALIAGVLLGFAGPARATIAVAVIVGVMVISVPTSGLPAQPEGSCDPFCATDGSMLSELGPFALLALPFLILPAWIGTAIRGFRRGRRRARGV
jgi:hypothetical protein